MTTSLNSVVPQRDSGFQSVQFLRRTFTVTDFPSTAARVVGGLPANAQVIGGGIVTTTAFTTATTLTVGYLDYDGTTTSAAAYSTALAINAAAGLLALASLTAATAAMRTVPTQVIVTPNAGATTANGSCDVIIMFVTKNPTSGAAA
jgi:hypothetical protein